MFSTYISQSERSGSACMGYWDKNKSKLYRSPFCLKVTMPNSYGACDECYKWHKLSLLQRLKARLHISLK